MKELKLEIEELESKIAPVVCLVPLGPGVDVDLPVLPDGAAAAEPHSIAIIPCP